LIKNLQKETLADFSGGRVTSENQATIPPNCLLVGRNVLVHAGASQPIPGYTVFKSYTSLGAVKINRQFEYERQTDHTHFMFVVYTDGGGAVKLGYHSMDDNSVPPTFLKIIPGSADINFFPTVHSLYFSNETYAGKVINDAGTDKVVPWGLQAPASALVVTIQAGTLNLTFGTSYVYCEVFQWTDNQGVTRFHIGPPSDFSAHTGPLAAKQVKLTGLAAVNPNTTHFWIFRVLDSIAGGSGSYFFVSAIPVASTFFIDNIVDNNLDTTIGAPFRNTPPTPSTIVLDWSKRAVMVNGEKVLISANDEIDQGIPQECFPSPLTFRVPSGSKTCTGASIFNQALMVATNERWFRLRNPNVDQFQEDDFIIGPGSVNHQGIRVIHGRLVWTAPDKKIWAWSGIDGDDPVPASVSIHASSEDQLTMGDIESTLIAQCQMEWYSNGTFDFAMLLVSSRFNESGEKDWVQMWDLSPIVGVKTIQGPLPQPALTDFFPGDKFECLRVGRENGVPYVYFGSATNGDIFRWPDGNAFNDEGVEAMFGSPWVKLGKTKAKLYWVKMQTNTLNAKDKFKLYAAVSSGTPSTVSFIEVPLEPWVDANIDEPTAARGKLNVVRGLTIGNWIRLLVAFPDDTDDHSVDLLEVSFAPIKGA
jgi:hypothetical protein